MVTISRRATSPNLVSLPESLRQARQLVLLGFHCQAAMTVRAVIELHACELALQLDVDRPSGRGFLPWLNRITRRLELPARKRRSLAAAYRTGSLAAHGSQVSVADAVAAVFAVSSLVDQFSQKGVMR